MSDSAAGITGPVTNPAPPLPVSGTSYLSRAIDVTLSLGSGTYGQTGFNSVKLSGLRVVATIEKRGFPSFDTAEIRVYGVPASIMNQLSSLGVPVPLLRYNSVLLEAGDAVNGMAVVYNGYSNQVWQNFDGAPDTCLQIIGSTGGQAAMQPTPPLSYPNGGDVATILAGIATRANWAFENNGVTAKLGPSYFPGTAMDQVHSIARQANIELYIDSGTPPEGTAASGTGTQSPGATLAIWPKGGMRGGAIPIISAQTGLVGYPRVSGWNLQFRSLFNPNLRLGGAVIIQSSLGNPAANVTPEQAQSAGVPTNTQTGGPSGRWLLTTPLIYDLSSQQQNGPWFVDATCSRLPGVPGS
jgi:hypothetical protein